MGRDGQPHDLRRLENQKKALRQRRNAFFDDAINIVPNNELAPIG